VELKFDGTVLQKREHRKIALCLMVCIDVVYRVGIYHYYGHEIHFSRVLNGIRVLFLFFCLQFTNVDLSAYFMRFDNEDLQLVKPCILHHRGLLGLDHNQFTILVYADLSRVSFLSFAFCFPGSA